VDVSVLVTVREHPEPLGPLYEELAAPLRRRGWRFEFVYAADPGHDLMLDALGPLRSRGEPIRVLEAAHPVGDAALLRAAVPYTRGEVVLLLPAYRRVEADGLVDLVERVRDGAEVVLARRWPRRDGALNRAQNWALHAIIRTLLRVNLNDVACGVRALRRGVFEQIPVYGDNARFIGVIAARLGYHVEEVEIPQHPSDVRAHVHPIGTYLRRLIDILGLFFVLRFTQKPLRFFGLVGAAFGLTGMAILAVLGAQKLSGVGIASRPLLLAGAILVVLGAQALAIGLIGEIVVFLNPVGVPPYRLFFDRAHRP
jgi:hypothetical protein